MKVIYAIDILITWNSDFEKYIAVVLYVEEIRSNYRNLIEK